MLFAQDYKGRRSLMTRLCRVGSRRSPARRPLHFPVPFVIALIKSKFSFRFFPLLRIHFSSTHNIRSSCSSPLSHSPLTNLTFPPSIMTVAGPVPSIVGALSCQKDSYLRTLKTSVVSCIEYTPPKNETKKSKKSKDPSPTEKETSTLEKTYLIELADSVLFPEGMFCHNCPYTFKAKSSQVVDSPRTTAPSHLFPRPKEMNQYQSASSSATVSNASTSRPRLSHQEHPSSKP
jgi:hypothetical protein